jgi:hypothetical protein
MVTRRSGAADGCQTPFAGSSCAALAAFEEFGRQTDRSGGEGVEVRGALCAPEGATTEAEPARCCRVRQRSLCRVPRSSFYDRPMALDPAVATELRASIDAALSGGESSGRRPSSTATTRRSGRASAPRRCARSTVPTLLETLHNTSNVSSLVYWLEFKNDDEMPAIFGSIAGGSALKFGLYRRRETGAWMTGHPSAQREALDRRSRDDGAPKHRDQLVAGAQFSMRSRPTPTASPTAPCRRAMEQRRAQRRGARCGGTSTSACSRRRCSTTTTRRSTSGSTSSRCSWRPRRARVGTWPPRASWRRRASSASR